MKLKMQKKKETYPNLEDEISAHFLNAGKVGV